MLLIPLVLNEGWMEEHFVNNTNIYVTIMDDSETKKD